MTTRFQDRILQFGRLLIAAFLVAGSSPTFAADITLNLGGPVFPPFYEEVDGKASGVLIDRMTMIMGGVGIKATPSLYPAARLMQNVTGGEIAVTMLVRNEVLDTAPDVIRSPLPIGELILNLYSHQRPVELTSRDDLRGKAIVVMRGYGYGPLRRWMETPETGIKLNDVDNFEAALRLVSTGRYLYALLYDVNYEAGVKALGAPPANVIANSFQRVPAYIYLNKKAVADADATMKALMASYRALQLKGTLPKMPGQEKFLETGDLTH